MSESTTRIAAIVQQACIDLFSHYAVDIAPRPSPQATPGIVLCGVIGFTGDDMRGCLMLACSQEPLRLAHAGGTGTMRDWIGELTNQLLGRVKNKLLGLGATIYCSTPVVIGGERIAPLSSQPLDHLFTADGGVVSVWFDSETRSDLVLQTCEIAVAREGETLLF